MKTKSVNISDEAAYKLYFMARHLDLFQGEIVEKALNLLEKKLGLKIIEGLTDEEKYALKWTQMDRLRGYRKLR
jgi:hypothetical protein